MPHRYHINLFWSDQDGCWIAAVPDLTYCSAHGPTPEAALAEVETAVVAAWLGVQAEAGRPAPEQRYRPATYAARVAPGAGGLHHSRPTEKRTYFRRQVETACPNPMASSLPGD